MPNDEAREEAEIRELWQTFEEIFFNLDAEGLSLLYAPDADRINPEGEVARGRSEIAGQYREIFANPELMDFFTQDWNIQPESPIETSVRLIRRDVAILDGRVVTDRGGKRYLNLFAVVLVKEQGQWWIAAGRDLRGPRAD